MSNLVLGVATLATSAALLLAPLPAAGQATAASTAAGASGPGELAGCWAGTFSAGASQTRGAFEFSPASGGWTGTIHRLGAELVSDTLQAITVQDGALSFTFPSSLGPEPARFEGSFDPQSLSGVFLSQGNQLPVEMTRVNPAVTDPALDLLGYWSGGVRQGGVVVLRLGVEIAPAPCGQAVASMDSPDQGAEGMPISSIRAEGDSLTFGVASVGGSFVGTVDRGAGRVEGTWFQNLQSIPLELERVDSVPSYSRPQDPEPPFPYAEEEVTFESLTDSVTLAGTLTVPEGEGPFPAALLITGSGAQDRDEALMGHRPFLVIADYLTRRGIAVLRVDDRGVGGSGGNVMETTIPENVGDALAGVRLLRAHGRIDPERVGLIGHSEGGWVAPAAVAESDDVAFVVMLAGPAVSPEDLLFEQGRLILEASGQEEMVEAQRELSGTFFQLVRDVPDEERLIEEMERARAEWLENLPPELADAMRAELELPGMEAQIAQQQASLTSRWFRGLLAFEPEPFLEAMDVPVLALFGDLDLQVPPAQSVPVLEEMWADHPDATIHVFLELNHLFQHAETGLMTEYAQIEETFAPEALEMMGDWIEQRFVEP